MRPMVTKPNTACFKHAPIVQEVEQELYEDVVIIIGDEGEAICEETM